MDLNEIVADIEPMLRRLIGERRQAGDEARDALGPVSADPGQLEQVLMNLAVNARDAMPDGGRLTIETAEVELDASTPRRSGRRARAVRDAVVTDTGTGMIERDPGAHLRAVLHAGKSKTIKHSGGKLNVLKALKKLKLTLRARRSWSRSAARAAPGRSRGS